LPSEARDVYLDHRKQLKFGHYRVKRSVVSPLDRARQLRREASLISIRAGKKKRVVAKKIAEEADDASSIAYSEKKQAENSLLKKRMIPQVEYVQTYSGRVLAVENPLYRQANQSFINHLDNAKYYKEQAAPKRENRLDVLDEVSDDFALVDDKRAKAARIEKDAIARANARSYQQKHSHGGKRYTTTDPWPTTQAHIPPVTHTASLPVYSTTPLDNNGGPTIPTQPTSMPYRTKQYTEYYQNPTPLRTRATSSACNRFSKGWLD